MNTLDPRGKILVFAVIPALTLLCVLGSVNSDMAATKSDAGPTYEFIQVQISERGSLTSCIENADVANEIEITGSSMKKAIRRVSGWAPKGSADKAESDGYCALSLV